MQLRYFTLFSLLVALALFVACGKGEDKQIQNEDVILPKSYISVGDSMIYGLACDGCSDSVLVLLPDSGGDPVYYNILEARMNRKVFGRPSIGDNLAIMTDSLNPDVITMLVNIEKVKGTWYYYEMPHLRHHIAQQDSNAVNRMLTPEQKERRDSFLRQYMVPREYVYTLKRDYTMVTSGGPPRNSSLDANTPVEYPKIKRYTEWHLHNGKLILTYGGMPVSGGRDSVELVNDTADFVLLRNDTMALRINGEVRGFKLKPDTIQ